MPDAPTALLLLFWLLSALFAAGAAAGFLPALLQRSRRLEAERLSAAGMSVSLACALIGGLAALAYAVAYLAPAYAAPTGRSVQAPIRVEIWRGLMLPDLALQPGEPHWNQAPFALPLRVDSLAALFVAMIGFYTVCVAIYSYGWLSGDKQGHTVAGGFNLFAATMLFVPLVDNAFWLLVALELVSLASAYLVLYRGRAGGPQEESRIAIRTYLIVSHISIMFLTAAILILGAASGSLSFDAFRAGRPALASVFLLALVGLGVRAAMTPFHFWAPIVHPQLPTNTHAMMSAVMLKLPIYLMIRFFLEFMQPAWWWGALVLLLAGSTALAGVFYALLSRDLKRALAYHSVENIGIILCGLGLALLFAGLASSGHLQVLRDLAALALAASLFHVLNHALFKTLLFLGVGSIENRTKTYDIDRLGGLFQRFRWTSVTFLVGAVAIAGFPPFNGFLSEWLTLQSLFAGRPVYQTGGQASVAILVVLLLTLVMLAAAFAMTALAFVKIAGETVLGQPRDPDVLKEERRGEVPWTMRGVMGLMALLCLAIGLVPRLVVPSIQAATAAIDYTATPLSVSFLDVRITTTAADGTLSYQAVLLLLPLGLLVIFPLLAALLAVIWHYWKGAQETPVWIGGEEFDAQTMQYTGSALSSLIWRPLLRRSSLPAVEGALPVRFQLTADRVVVEYFNRGYNVLLGLLSKASAWAGSRLQNGDIRLYLLYVFAAFVGALVVFAVTR